MSKIGKTGKINVGKLEKINLNKRLKITKQIPNREIMKVARKLKMLRMMLSRVILNL